MLNSSTSKKSVDASKLPYTISSAIASAEAKSTSSHPGPSLISIVNTASTSYQLESSSGGSTTKKSTSPSSAPKAAISSFHDGSNPRTDLSFPPTLTSLTPGSPPSYSLTAASFASTSLVLNSSISSYVSSSSALTTSLVASISKQQSSIILPTGSQTNHFNPSVSALHSSSIKNASSVAIASSAANASSASTILLVLPESSSSTNHSSASLSSKTTRSSTSATPSSPSRFFLIAFQGPARPPLNNAGLNRRQTAQNDAPYYVTLDGSITDKCIDSAEFSLGQDTQLFANGRNLYSTYPGVQSQRFEPSAQEGDISMGWTVVSNSLQWRNASFVNAYAHFCAQESTLYVNFLRDIPAGCLPILPRILDGQYHLILWLRQQDAIMNLT